jgi:hypothetical protein
VVFLQELSVPIFAATESAVPKNGSSAATISSLTSAIMRYGFRSALTRTVLRLMMLFELIKNHIHSNGQEYGTSFADVLSTSRNHFLDRLELTMLKKGGSVKTESVHFYEDEDKDSADEYEDDYGIVLNAPKRSSIRRKERFRARETVPDTSSKSRRKHKRQSIRTDAKFWEV